MEPTDLVDKATGLSTERNNPKAHLVAHQHHRGPAGGQGMEKRCAPLHPSVLISKAVGDPKGEAIHEQVLVGVSFDEHVAELQWFLNHQPFLIGAIETMPLNAGFHLIITRCGGGDIDGLAIRISKDEALSERTFSAAGPA